MYDSTPALSGADKVLKCRAPSHKAVSHFRHPQLLDCHRPAAPSLGSVRSRRTAHGTGITQLEAMTVVSATVSAARHRQRRAKGVGAGQFPSAACSSPDPFPLSFHELHYAIHGLDDAIVDQQSAQPSALFLVRPSNLKAPLLRNFTKVSL